MIRGLVTIFCCCLSIVGTAQQLNKDAQSVLRQRILANANWALSEKPVTVTAQYSSRSAGGKHDFYSEGDYWWPNPVSADSPYIQKDGMTNPENFVAHRHAMVRFSKIAGACASAYILTRKIVMCVSW